MKRKFSILFLSLAVLFMIAAIVIPHHHHEGQMVILLEDCPFDMDNGDEHGNKSANDHESFCIEKADYITSVNKKEIKCSSSCDHHHHVNILPICYLLVENLGADISIDREPEHVEYIFNYKPSDQSVCHGLRAPPVSFS